MSYVVITGATAKRVVVFSEQEEEVLFSTLPYIYIMTNSPIVWTNESSGLYIDEVEACVAEELETTVENIQTFNGESSNDIYRVQTVDEEYIVKIFSYPYMEPGMARSAGYIQRVLASNSTVVPQNYFIGEYGEIPYIIHISEFVSGATIPHGWRELFDEQRQEEEVQRVGHLVGILQEAKTFDVCGEVVGYEESTGFEVRADSWEQTVKQIFNRRRDHSYEVGLFDDEIIDEFISIVEPIVDSWSIQFSDSVLCHNDIRLPNIAVPTDDDSVGYVVDWDNVAVGDWVFGFARAEYTVSNKPSQSSFSRSDARSVFRDSFFKQSSHSSLPSRYYVYRALCVLQEIRSFKYWYQNESEEYKSQQRGWLKSEINRIMAKIDRLEL